MEPKLSSLGTVTVTVTWDGRDPHELTPRVRVSRLVGRRGRHGPLFPGLCQCFPQAQAVPHSDDTSSYCYYLPTLTQYSLEIAPSTKSTSALDFELLLVLLVDLSTMGARIDCYLDIGTSGVQTA